MHNVAIMEVLQPQNQLYTVKFDFSFRKFFLLPEDLGQLATSHEGHHIVETYFSREEVINLGQKLMFGIREDLQLSVSLFNTSFIY